MSPMRGADVHTDALCGYGPPYGPPPGYLVERERGLISDPRVDRGGFGSGFHGDVEHEKDMRGLGERGDDVFLVDKDQLHARSRSDSAYSDLRDKNDKDHLRGNGSHCGPNGISRITPTPDKVPVVSDVVGTASNLGTAATIIDPGPAHEQSASTPSLAFGHVHSVYDFQTHTDAWNSTSDSFEKPPVPVLQRSSSAYTPENKIQIQPPFAPTQVEGNNILFNDTPTRFYFHTAYNLPSLILYPLRPFRYTLGLFRSYSDPPLQRHFSSPRLKPLHPSLIALGQGSNPGNQQIQHSNNQHQVQHPHPHNHNHHENKSLEYNENSFEIQRRKVIVGTGENNTST